MVDPLLEGRFSVKSVQHAIVITTMCLQEHASARPAISEVVPALEFLASQPEEKDSRKGRSHSPLSPTPCLLMDS